MSTLSYNYYEHYQSYSNKYPEKSQKEIESLMVRDYGFVAIGCIVMLVIGWTISKMKQKIKKK